ncbi:SDR family NAD(P)-dependent oxidoreductase, partial [Streptomyces sp. NPDC127049]|uniref:SDR family NAD(P)-dependent oxidoreductase n=1 Tax=Streptomyces sp. NPDC127049 TaxID=3347118 RepID=UPI00364C31A9
MTEHTSMTGNGLPHHHTTLVTGATQGLGRGIALELAARGGTVLLHGRDAGRLAAVAAEVRALGARGGGAGPTHPRPPTTPAAAPAPR